MSDRTQGSVRTGETTPAQGTATGQQPRWDDTVVTAALEARQILPAENRRALFEEISAAMGLDEVAIPFAEAVPAPGNGPAIDRLIAWNGRDPRH